MPSEELEEESRSQGELLSTALRAIRRERRLRTSEVARAMGMPLRSYEHFEAGRGRLDLARLERFADATDSDPYAIVAAIILKRPGLALRASDNKLMVVMMLALDDFDDDLGEDIRLLEPRVLVGAFRRVFQDLAEHVRKRDLSVERWLDDRSRKVGLPLGFVKRWRRRP
jgi:transcriptional regulator with XRE-family HTH domain